MRLTLSEDGWFVKKTLYVDSDVTLADMQEMAAKQILIEERAD